MVQEIPHQIHPPEEKETLWLVFISPSIWAVHFLICYTLAAVWCEKYAASGADFQSVQIMVGVLTLIALAGIGFIGWVGFRRHRLGTDKLPHDDDTPLDRHRFLGFSTFLLSLLSAVATLFVAVVFVVVGNCE